MFGQLALTLHHVDAHTCLTILRCREVLMCLRRNRAVAHDEFGHSTTDSLDTERERNHIEEKKIAPPARKDGGLHACAKRNHAIGIKRDIRLATEVRGNSVAYRRQSCRSADEHHAVDLRCGGLGVAHRARTRGQRASYEGRRSCVEFSARQDERARMAVNPRLNAHRLDVC